jgi:hypothetical protein
MIKKMKLTFIFLAGLLAVVNPKLHAQERGLRILLGPAVTLYKGTSEQGFGYSNPHLSLQANGQIGFVSAPNGVKHGNMLAVYASAGYLNPEMIALLQQGGAILAGNINYEKKVNEFYNLEGGFTIAGFLRMSGGIGRQYYNYLDAANVEQKGILKYYSGTLGVVFNLDAIAWVIDAKIMTGLDLNQTALSMSTGFLIRF